VASAAAGFLDLDELGIPERSDVRFAQFARLVRASHVVVLPDRLIPATSAMTITYDHP
jgi:hypothetical protein